MTGVEKAVRDAIRFGLMVSDGEYGHAKEMGLAQIRAYKNRELAGLNHAIETAQETGNQYLVDELTELKSEQDLTGTSRLVAFADRFDRAVSRLEAEQQNTEGVFITFRDVEETAPESDYVDPETVSEEASVEVVAQKCYREHHGGVTIESEYPMVALNGYTVCTGPDKHYDSASCVCYHEIARILYEYETGATEDWVLSDQTAIGIESQDNIQQIEIE